MRLKAPRWLLVLEAVLFAGALLVLAYKAAIRIPSLPLDGVAQTRSMKKPDRQAQLMAYYRDYPDRYLRIMDETWLYNPVSRTALHSFSIRNIATASYKSIEITFSYQNSEGKVLLTRTVTITGPVAPSATLPIKNLKVSGVPAATKTVVAKVAKATVVS